MSEDVFLLIILLVITLFIQYGVVFADIHAKQFSNRHEFLLSLIPWPLKAIVSLYRLINKTARLIRNLPK